MKQILITSVLSVVLGLVSAPSNASGYVVNGHAASPAEAQLLVATGVQPGTWVVNGYGVAPAAQNANPSSDTAIRGKQCWYVLDVQLCD